MGIDISDFSAYLKKDFYTKKMSKFKEGDIIIRHKISEMIAVVNNEVINDMQTVKVLYGKDKGNEHRTIEEDFWQLYKPEFKVGDWVEGIYFDSIEGEVYKVLDCQSDLNSDIIKIKDDGEIECWYSNQYFVKTTPPEPEPKFKIGDKVRKIKDGCFVVAKNGTIGVVKGVGDMYIYVDFNDGKGNWGLTPDMLEPVKESSTQWVDAPKPDTLYMQGQNISFSWEPGESEDYGINFWITNKEKKMEKPKTKLEIEALKKAKEEAIEQEIAERQAGYKRTMDEYICAVGDFNKAKKKVEELEDILQIKDAEKKQLFE